MLRTALKLLIHVLLCLSLRIEHQLIVNLRQRIYESSHPCFGIPGRRHSDDIRPCSHFHLKVIALQQDPVKLLSCKRHCPVLYAFSPQSLHRDKQF